MPETRARQHAVFGNSRDPVGLGPGGGTPQHFAGYLKVEIAKWGKVVRAGNIKAE